MGRGDPAAAADARAGRAAHHRGALVAPAGAAGAGAEWSSIHTEAWPAVDAAAIAAETREVPVQVNGKVRDKVVVPVGLDQAELERLVLARPRIVELLAGRAPDRVIHAGGRLVNIVVRG